MIFHLSNGPLPNWVKCLPQLTTVLQFLVLLTEPTARKIGKVSLQKSHLNDVFVSASKSLMEEEIYSAAEHVAASLGVLNQSAAAESFFKELLMHVVVGF